MSLPSAGVISSSCRVLGLKAPPTSKRILKKHFIDLAKKNHPDRIAAQFVTSSSSSSSEAEEGKKRQRVVEAATHRMAELTEAYKTLEPLCCDSKEYRANKLKSMTMQEGKSSSMMMDPSSFANPLNIDFEAERNTPEARTRRETSMERTWLPWLKKPREEVEGARPLAENAQRLTLFRLLAIFCPERLRVLISSVFAGCRLRSWRMMQAAKFIVLGK